MLDLIIRGGRVVTPGTVAELDVGIEGERISVIAEPGTLPEGNAREIDASGLVVLPGGIEPHAHIAQRVNLEWSGGRRNVYTQSPDAASLAAVFGGVTTIVDFASEQRNRREASIAEDVEARAAVFAGHSHADFCFHYILFGEVPQRRIEQIGEAVEGGIASFKVFTTMGRTRVPYGHLGGVMSEVVKQGAILAVHAEEDDVVNYMRQKLKREGRDQGYNLPLVHNNLSEDLSFRTVIRIARHAGTALYLLHVTAREGLDAIAEARARDQAVYGEALHNYLHFIGEDYRKPEGTTLHTYPSLKSAEDRDALIAGVLDGRLSTVATDDYTTHKDIKLSGQTLETVCGGHNGIETRIPVAYTKLVHERGMSLARFADVIATNAARILGLFPRKGAILPGSDADLVLFDPELRKTIALEDLHADSDYSIWDGFACAGYPATTLLRGKVVVNEGKLLGSLSDGQWLPRRVEPEVLHSPAI